MDWIWFIITVIICVLWISLLSLIKCNEKLQSLFSSGNNTWSSVTYALLFLFIAGFPIIISVIYIETAKSLYSKVIGFVFQVIVLISLRIIIDKIYYYIWRKSFYKIIIGVKNPEKYTNDFIKEIYNYKTNMGRTNHKYISQTVTGLEKRIKNMKFTALKKDERKWTIVWILLIIAMANFNIGFPMAGWSTITLAVGKFLWIEWPDKEGIKGLGRTTISCAGILTFSFLASTILDDQLQDRIIFICMVVLPLITLIWSLLNKKYFKTMP